MESVTMKKADMLIKNRQIMKSGFRTSGKFKYLLGASYATNINKTIDIDKVHECKDYIKQASGRFSYFNSLISLDMSTRLSFEENYRAEFESILNVYDALKKTFRRSILLPQIAILFKDQPNVLQLISRTELIFNELRKNHPWLTNYTHVAYAALMARCDRDISEMVSDAEECFSLLRKRFFYAESALTLSYVLALYKESPEEKVLSTMNLFNALSSRKLKYGTVLELPSLGIFAAATAKDDLDNVAREIAEVANYLKANRGFGASMSVPQRLMLAASVVLNDDNNAHRANDIPFSELFQQLNITYSVCVCSQQGS